MHQIHIVKMMFEYFSNGWLGGGLEKWRLKLSQFPTKLKLKLCSSRKKLLRVVSQVIIANCH